jgi:hypothetical protein
MLSQNSDRREPMICLLRLSIVALTSSLAVASLLFLCHHRSLEVNASQPNLDEYETRKAQLPARAAQPFVDDPMRDVETDLDRRPFQQINALIGPKLIDNPEGWSVEARAGGRPFMNFDDIRLNGAPWEFDPDLFAPGGSGIPQSELDSHFAAGKTVNRLWFIHKASNGWPIVVVMTSDGFLNAGGALSPTLQGAAVRLGFVGEPFSEDDDYLQHVDAVNIVEIDADTLVVIYDVHSEAGEGILEVELQWIAATERPELHFRSAHVPRSDARLGFVGLNFMRGPTLSGLLSQYGAPEDGIEAFHDGRSVFLVHRSGAIMRDLLVPPVMTDTVVREDIAADVAIGSKVVMDQPQYVERYFSKHPGVPYEHRADLILKLDNSTASSVSVRKAQIAVDLTDSNPEANETVNVFYAVDMDTGQLYEFSFTLEVAARDFEQLYGSHQQGVVFTSDRSESSTRLYFLPLDDNLAPAGPAVPLTDRVIVDPRRLSSSADGRLVIFDADDYGVSTRQRVYTLDLSSAAVRRLTVDPFGASNDWGASLNAEGSHFAMITSRRGTTYRLNVQEVSSGLGSGFGNDVAIASSADWCHTRNEIVFVQGTNLRILNVETEVVTDVVSCTGIHAPKLSPDCAKIAYVAPTGLFVVNRDGSGNTQVLLDGDYTAWVDETRWIVQRTVGGNTDLYRVDVDTSQAVRLTTDPGVDAEPTFVKAVGPTIEIESPSDGDHSTAPLEVSGCVGSVGIPTVTVDGTGAKVDGDRWSVTLTLGIGERTLAAVVTDGATGLTAQDQVTVVVDPPPPTDVLIRGPATGAVNAVHTFTAGVSPTTVATPITYVWGATAQSPVTHTGGLSDVVAFSWGTTGGKAITVTATNIYGTGTGTHVIHISHKLYLPLVLKQG